MKLTQEQEFWAYVKFTDSCWLWQGPKSNGYGAFGRKAAHRVSFELTYGPIPIGLYVCHHCDIPPCVRPEHLFLGTNKDNQDDATRKGKRLQPKSLEHRAKLRAAHLGRKLSPEHIAKQSAGKMGHSVSLETRAKISAAKKAGANRRRLLLWK